MSLKLKKLEVEVWTYENLDRFRKEQFKSFVYEDMKGWQESDILPEYRDQKLIDVLNDICKRSGYDTWCDFELHYTNPDNGDEYTFSYTDDGELLAISRNNIPYEDVSGSVGFDATISNLETMPIPTI